MPTPRRRRPFLRVLAVALASSALVFAAALPAHAAPVVSEVPGGAGVSTLTEYQGLLYLGSQAGLQSFDGTTFTTIGVLPESPRDFVEFDGDLWMVGGPLAGPTSLWRFDGTSLTEFVVEADNPVVVGARLYFRSFTLGTFLAWTDGTTTAFEPSPPDLGEIALAPNGDVALTAGTPRTLWTFDGTTFTEVVDPAAPVDVFELQNLSAALVFQGEATAGDDDAAYTWDGTAFARLGAAVGAATDTGCFVESAGTLYYAGDDGTRRMFSATPSVPLSEVAVTPTVAEGCPRYIASDGTFYLQAQGTGPDATLHTWDGATLIQLDSVGNFPSSLIEFGGKIYFTAQAASETSSLFVLEDVIVPAGPTDPLLPPTGGVVSWWLIAVAALLLGGGAGILIIFARRRRISAVDGASH